MKFNKPRGGSEPLRTFTELAEEFGISVPALCAEMANSKIPHPKAVNVCRATAAGHPHRSYYKPSEMRRWWKQHKASKSCPKSTGDS